MPNQATNLLRAALPAALLGLIASGAGHANPKNESIQEQNLYNYGTTKPTHFWM
jgi:hypothetical protein